MKVRPFFVGSIASSTLVMPAFDAGIHDFDTEKVLKSWMPDMKSGMTL